MTGKVAYIFDWDETLVTTAARIHVYRNGAHHKSMDSKQYNFYKPHPEDTYDFAEFKDPELILNAKQHKMWPTFKNINKAIKEKRSTSEMFILTARSLHVKSAIYEYLKQHGIDIDMEHIITIGDDAGKINISEEKRKILSKMAKQYDKVVFFDDDPKNIAIAAGIQGIKTRLVESQFSGMSLKELLAMKKQYMQMFTELKIPPKYPSRDIYGNEMKRNSTPFKNLQDEYKQLTTMIAKLYLKKFRKEGILEDMGGVSAPISTPMNTPGMGNAVPAGNGTVGSGDNWGDASIGMQTNEENINPYDKIGMAMAKKMGVKPPFKKKKAKGNQNSIVQKKFEHQIITLDEFTKELNENKK